MFVEEIDSVPPSPRSAADPIQSQSPAKSPVRPLGELPRSPATAYKRFLSLTRTPKKAKHSATSQYPELEIVTVRETLSPASFADTDSDLFDSPIKVVMSQGNQENTISPNRRETVKQPLTQAERSQRPQKIARTLFIGDDDTVPMPPPAPASQILSSPEIDEVDTGAETIVPESDFASVPFSVKMHMEKEFAAKGYKVLRTAPYDHHLCLGSRQEITTIINGPEGFNPPNSVVGHMLMRDEKSNKLFFVIQQIKSGNFSSLSARTKRISATGLEPSILFIHSLKEVGHALPPRATVEIPAFFTYSDGKLSGPHTVIEALHKAKNQRPITEFRTSASQEVPRPATPVEMPTKKRTNPATSKKKRAQPIAGQSTIDRFVRPRTSGQSPSVAPIQPVEPIPQRQRISALTNFFLTTAKLDQEIGHLETQLINNPIQSLPALKDFSERFSIVANTGRQQFRSRIEEIEKALQRYREEFTNTFDLTI